ncbi:MAG: UDP-N-acetylmuramoyl-L-alanine--D-glutamate ligase [Peptococcaceae bacterium]|jgi:UDP-N-acetylmuramoylalanine--D-glutamate ligase|nr:UDP-N-acetylmuramoyl-L-alanine--D-glutamate ligase [Peptococcaceae bacterium]MDH7524358.1 UDP-N-acetylmuramoyl-L-alanine--D-glutamate ligase [Peptococcaceae bacterium]
MNLEGKRILMIGAARSGIAAARFLNEMGARVVLNDKKNREELEKEALDSLEKKGIELVFGLHPDIEKIPVDLIIMSPGVPLTIPTVRSALEKGIPVWSEMELAARFNKAPIVAVTGTNGKTTTTALIGRIFTDAGRNVFIGGNIGMPFISKAAELKEGDVVVLEASSFQLETTQTFKPKVALALNLTPDHLDRHGSFAGYIEAKARIFANQDKDDWLILNWDDEETKKFGDRAASKVIFFSRKNILEQGFCVENGYLTARMGGRSTPIIRTEEIYIKGGHNLENALAAAAAGWVMGVGPDSLKESLATFPGVPHRLEHVLVHKGIEYVNDSKGTNPDAAIKALDAFDRPIVLIAGGKNKGVEFTEFAKKVKEKVKALVLLGQAAGEIESAVKKIGYTSYYHARTYPEAVEKASSLAKTGDIVLLSPACTSWDMFNNFEERGELFKELVRELAARE